MNGKLCDLVRFEIDRLFNGAVDVDWLQNNEAKASRAAVAFVALVMSFFETPDVPEFVWNMPRVY